MPVGESQALRRTLDVSGRKKAALRPPLFRYRDALRAYAKPTMRDAVRLECRSMVAQMARS